MRKPSAILGHPVFWGVVATVAVAGFGVWVAGFEHYDENWVLRSNWEHFKAAAPNEIGDTLAGFAGALAFVWIIVTVWLQSKELAAQREELRLTRNEMEDQRKATQDMARSLAAQATVFEDEKKSRDEAAAKEELDILLKGISDLLHMEAQAFSSGYDREYFFQFFTTREGRSPDEHILANRNFYYDFTMHADSAPPLVQSILPYQMLRKRVSDVAEIFPQLSRSQHARIRNTGIKELEIGLDQLLNGDFWDDRAHDPANPYTFLGGET